MRTYHLSGLVGIMLLLTITLTGCSPFSTNDSINQASNEISDVSSSSWLLTAQGQGGSPNCVRALPPGQAKKLVEKALKEKREVRSLQQALERRGKKLVFSRAHGCTVKKNSPASAQSVSAQQETTELTLIEVPASQDAALYLLEDESTQETNSWAALVSSGEGGQWVTHLEVGLEEEVTTPEEPVGVDLFLPDQIGTQGIASQVQPLLSATAGSQGLQAQGLDWSQAQVVILDADLEEATALVVVPEVNSTPGQALLGGGNNFDLDQAVYTAVKVQRVSAGGGAGGTWQVMPTPVAELPVIQLKPKPVPTPPKLPAPKPAPPSPPPPPPAPPVKMGVELPKPTLPYCPAPYLGPVGVASRLQCMDYDERWYEKQWEYELRPIADQQTAQIYNWAQQATSTATGIVAITGAQGDLLIAGLKQADSTKLRELYKAIMTNSGPPVGGALSILCSLLGFASDVACAAAGVTAGFIQYLVELLTPGNGDSDLKIEILAIMAGNDTIQMAYAHNPAFKKFIDQINAVLQEHGFAGSAMDLMQSFLAACQAYSVCSDLIFGLGALPVIATGYLLQVTPSGNYSFPSNMAQFLNNLASMVDAHVQNLQTLVEELAAAAYAASRTQQGSSAGLALIAQVEILVDKIFPQMQAKGNWAGMEFVSNDLVPFGFVASYAIKNNPNLASAFPGAVRLNALTLIEPNLTNVDAVIEGLENAAVWMLSQPRFLNTNGSVQNVIVQYVDREGYPGALSDLCRDVATQTFGTSSQHVPVVVVTWDGNVACHSPDITDEQARQVCLTHGFSSCNNEHRESGSGGGGGGGGNALPSPDAPITIEEHNDPSPACKNTVCVTGLDIPPRGP